MELLLFFSIDVKDTKPLAKELLARYGSLGAVLKAEPGQLAEFHDLRRDDPSIDAYAAYRLSDLYERDRQRPEARSEAGGRWRAFEEDQGRPLGDRAPVAAARDRGAAEAGERAVAAGAARADPGPPGDQLLVGAPGLPAGRRSTHEPIEQFRVMFLDRKNILIKDEVQQRGTVDHTPLYPREIVKRALELGASSIIMVHNHPSGDPTPSRADLEMTKQVVSALAAVGITGPRPRDRRQEQAPSFKSQRLI